MSRRHSAPHGQHFLIPGTFKEQKAPVYVDGKLCTTLRRDRIVAEFKQIPGTKVESVYGQRAKNDELVGAIASDWAGASRLALKILGIVYTHHLGADAVNSLVQLAHKISRRMST